MGRSDRLGVNPARAGMIRTSPTRTASRSGKPRASGDDPVGIWALSLPFIVNPARAGMIPPPEPVGDRRQRKPRASGDDPHLKISYSAAVE